ncbi:MAG: FAD-dependent oxidoreductase [Oscillospiraceae bacterium]|nr:FAD-dependent oxidoreductase [Oscillospiraceae bacterium]
MKYVIIGNSAAGIGAVEGIRKIDKQGEIVIITSESHHTYSRPLISYLLQGKTTRTKMRYRPDSFYKDNNCKLLHDTVTKIHANEKRVVLQSKDSVNYDKLLVATGSSAFNPPLFESVSNKHNFITLDDACGLADSLTSESRVLIVGAGLIGLKCAEGILSRVKTVTVADIAERILSAILDESSSEIVQSHLESKGIEFKLACALTPNELSNYDIIVVAAGVRPNIALLEGIADIDKGIIVNTKSETSAKGIYAAGDCTQSVDVSTGESKIMALLPNAYMQGETAGINMAGGNATTEETIPMNAVGLCGLHIITAGNYTGEVSNVGNNRFYCNDTQLNGYILIGDIKQAGVYTNLIRKKRALSDKQEVLKYESKIV